MTPHEAILQRLHYERMAGHHFSMLMIRLGVGMREGAPVEDLVRGGV